mmetsp:Transcript_20266/g.33345  ORF Transcript_20266/g.33345 Transcript_20266/m.33345 type:complete len:684 (+) Transcript_20266:40-2091(+)
MDAIELDNERHKREEQERRAKRKAHRSAKSKSESQTEKERKRKEHAARILGQQQQQQPSSSSGKKPSSRSSSKKSPSKKQQPQSTTTNSSIFQSLFHQRAQGFLIDFHFRNAPPRPPVGPCFVGLGLEGELTDKWTKYKARNAVEKQYVWKLHSGNELYSVPLAVSAMDYEGCYVDPERGAEKQQQGEDIMMEEEDLLGDNLSGVQQQQKKKAAHVIPPLHPDDEALINWKGSMGDTAAEQLQQKRDRARAAARLAIAQGYGSLSAAQALATTPLGGGANAAASATAASGNGGTPAKSGSKVMKLKKKHHLHSRILDEQTPHFMKKTTYLTNTATSVHQFTSLAHTQEQRAKEVDRALAETSERYKKEDRIEMGFREANSWDVQQVLPGGETDTNVDAAADKNKKKRRVHPSKKGVYPVWDLPLLPDVPTWGHTYAHVVLDHPPKSIPKNAATATPAKKKGGKESGNHNIVSAQQLQQAIVADVSKQTQNSRMACTVWVPDTSSSAVSDSESPKEDEKEQPPTKKAKKEESSEAYHAVQRYDLDVLPLRDPSGPHVHYVWMIDPSKKYVGYHPVGSRVQLSTGRPIGGTSRYGSKETDEGVGTTESLIYRRGMDVDERKDMEKRMAEVDVDMAEKYGLVEDELDEDVGEKKKGGGSGMEVDGEKKAGTSSSDDSDAELEKDAF